MRKNSKLFFKLTLIAILSFPAILAARQTVIAVKVDKAPEIDGQTDSLWSKASPIITYNRNDKAKIKLKALYSKSHIYFWVQYDDKDESRTHKSWTWNKVDKMYDQGSDREDAFVFKWSMEDKKVDMKLEKREEHRADIWFWKALRTDPSKVADDKMHIYSKQESKKAKLINAKGKKMYLVRKGDSGQSAYETVIVGSFAGNKLSAYKARRPSGSRSDISAKGKWQSGVWTVEFARKLNTGHDDDLQFKSLNKSYPFGVSITEISGKKRDKKLEGPIYGYGEIDETLYLKFNEEVR